MLAKGWGNEQRRQGPFFFPLSSWEQDAQEAVVVYHELSYDSVEGIALLVLAEIQRARGTPRRH